MTRERGKILKWEHIKLHIKLHKPLKNKVVTLKGVAAFFVSTNLYIFFVVSNKYYSVLFTRAADSVSTRVFLFLQITDKPHDGISPLPFAAFLCSIQEIQS